MKGYSVLFAFVENRFCCSWKPVWYGNSLRDLKKDEFEYFKKFYGISNLSVTHTFCEDPFDQINEFFDVEPFDIEF